VKGLKGKAVFNPRKMIIGEFLAALSASRPNKMVLKAATQGRK
jgi:hypothetical protein